MHPPWLASAASCLSFRLLPARPEKPHKSLTATQRAAALAEAKAAGSDSAHTKHSWRSWLPWGRKAATAAPPPAGPATVTMPSKAEDGAGGRAGVTVVRVDAADLHHQPDSTSSNGAVQLPGGSAA